MTSGRAGTKRWLLEFEPQSAPFIEPLMGWTGSTDPMTEVRLSFPSRESAVAYAQRQGLAYEVREVVEQARSCATAVKPESDAIPFWPMPLLESELNDLLIAEAGPTRLAPNLAA